MASLDKEEKELLGSYERDEWRSVPDRNSELERYNQYARSSHNEDVSVTIHLSKGDLEALQTRALEEGIPYQTLIGSVLHKYVDGRLVEKGR